MRYMCTCVWPEVSLLSNIILLSFETGSLIHLGLAIQYPRLSRRPNAWSFLKMFVCLFSSGCETRTLVFLGEYSTSELQAGLERSFFQKINK